VRTAAGATLPISIITADDAKARMDHHEAELRKAWQDYYTTALLTMLSGCPNFEFSKCESEPAAARCAPLFAMAVKLDFSSSGFHWYNFGDPIPSSPAVYGVTRNPGSKPSPGIGPGFSFPSASVEKSGGI
jgi:hypothetical protein